MLTPHVRLNLTQLVHRLHALPGVQRYLLCSGCERASLWRWRGVVPPKKLEHLILLDSLPQEHGSSDPPLLLALPLGWARGLVDDSAAAQLEDLAGAGWEWLGLHRLPAAAAPVESQLGRLWQQYRGLGERASSRADLIELLRLELLLRRRFAPGSLSGANLRPWPMEDWLGELPNQPEPVATDLVALLQLLGPPEQGPLAETLAVHIEMALAQQEGDPLPWLRLLEALVGGINSRDPRLQTVAERLRALGIKRGAGLVDPAARGLVLARLLQAPGGHAPAELGCLAGAIDALVLAIDEATASGDQMARRQCQRQLEAILRGAGPNLLLLRALVQVLAPETCYRLPSLQPPSVCLQLLKGALLLDSQAMAALGGERRKALVALVERILPRIWWQHPLLVRLIHDLRRFRLDLAWLRHEGQLLTGLELLHSRGIPPLPQVPATPLTAIPPLEAPDPHLLLRTQVRLLLRLQPQPGERSGLLRLASSAGKPPLLRLLDGEDEEAPAMAAAAGLAPRSVCLARLAAERRGVHELLPPSLAAVDLHQAFQEILAHWRSCFGVEAGRQQAPIAVVITTHAPTLALLRLALESLALQTLWPQEVWLVDDGSPAAAAAGLAALVASCRRDLGLPLRLLRRQDNQGQYACRNLALAAMTTAVLAIQDDDDLSHPLRLATQWQALQRGCAAVYGRHLRLDQDTAAPQADGDGGDFFGDGVTTLMVARSTARGLGGFYPVRSRGDVEFRGRLERRYGVGQVLRLQQPLYLMRGGTTTISSGFEYGCSLALPSWRRLMDREVLV